MHSSFVLRGFEFCGDIHTPMGAANPLVNTLATIRCRQVNSLVSPDGAPCDPADDPQSIGLFTVYGLDQYRVTETASRHWTNS
jgi:hypothetical protein